MDVLRTVVSMSGLVFVLALLVNVVAVPAVAGALDVLSTEVGYEVCW